MIWTTLHANIYAYIQNKYIYSHIHACMHTYKPTYVRCVRTSVAHLEKIIPERGPRRLLCVVDVTTWQCSKGSAASRAATRPEMCAISAIRYAPTSSATCWRASQAGSRDTADLGKPLARNHKSFFESVENTAVGSSRKAAFAASLLLVYSYLTWYTAF